MPNRFTQYDEDAYRLPEGMRRIAYDADTQRYTFRDRSGQLYQSAPGEEFGVLRPVAAPLPHRRNVTITELPDPALRRWSEKPAKTFNDILPSGYITAAQSGIDAESPTSYLSPSEKFVQAAMPKVQDVAKAVKRRTTLKRPVRDLTRSDSLMDEKRRLLEEDSWEIVRKDEVMGGRLTRSKSEVHPPRYYSRK
ncbi:hypothetical protein HD554DRAFT_2065451 [Boletus coccyginus]|nr:hypothetical protein HD554DRAFT_2065451 [Boletus coccyginus]